MIANHGLERVREACVKHIEGPLWKIRIRIAAVLAAAIALVVLFARISLTNEVVISDGDSLRIEGKRIRLWGIDV